jgi:hypothetical protein
MSIECMAWALEQQGLEPVDKLVLLGIANHADRDGGNAWPSLTTLALYVGRGDQTVRRSIRELQKRGLVTVTVQGGSSKHGGYRSNLYQVNMGRAITCDIPEDDRAITHDQVGLSPVIDQGYQGRDRRTIQEPSKNHSSSDIELMFNKFWLSYPRKVGKIEAQRQFTKVMKSSGAPTLTMVLDAVALLVAEKREMQFIPHPRTWLSHGRWLDQTTPERDEPAVQVVQKQFCGSCRSGWVLVVEDGVERASRCKCQR